MSLFMLESVNSLYDYFDDDVTFTAETLLGFGGEIPRKTHIRVCWGDGSLEEGSGEFDSNQGIYIEGWVFDDDGNARYAAYQALSTLLRAVIKRLYLWRDAHPELDLDISVLNHADAFAPLYGFQINANTSSNHICRVIDAL
jgi:hypothetical protein